jgi:HAMP domain-containing protein
MAPPPPLWRRLYDSVERAVAPPLDSLVRSERFARGMALASWATSMTRELGTELSARVWHLVNLPAGTDVARLRTRIGELDREVRRLALRLERSTGEPRGATSDPAASQPVDQPAEGRRGAGRDVTDDGGGRDVTDDVDEDTEEATDAVAARATNARSANRGGPGAARGRAQRPARP